MRDLYNHLDAQLRHEMRREIRALQQRLGMSMIYVTHDQGEAMSMADQVILLREGRIEQDASPAELYVTPVLWPDFTRRHLFEAILEFQRRERRFGRVEAG